MSVFRNQRSANHPQRAPREFAKTINKRFKYRKYKLSIEKLRAIGNTGLISVIWYFYTSKEFTLCKKDRKFDAIFFLKHKLSVSSFSPSRSLSLLSHTRARARTHAHICQLFSYVFVTVIYLQLNCTSRYNQIVACKHFVKAFLGVRKLILCVLSWKKFGRRWSMQW
jgi:hypothetical protein